MTNLRYKDLTKEQKAFACNGCGAKGGWIKPPNFLFKASCNHHDFNYLSGYKLKHKIKADWQFYKAMCSDAKEARWWKVPFYITMASTYYTAVSTAPSGFKAFRFAKHELTLEELNKMMR